MRPSCSECESEIETSFVWTLEYEPVCGDCMRQATPPGVRWMVSLVERLVEPVYRAREEARRN